MPICATPTARPPAFLYGWSLLLVIQSGGMAAVAITFARYFLELTHLPLAEGRGRRARARLAHSGQLPRRPRREQLQSGLMLLKIAAIAALVAARLAVRRRPPRRRCARRALDRPLLVGLLPAFGAAMTPVMFAYGGWQTASFVAGEMRDPRRDLARGLLIGVAGVVAALHRRRLRLRLRAGRRTAWRQTHDARVGGDAAGVWASAARP